MGTHYSNSIFLVDHTEIKIATGSYGNHSVGQSQTVNVFDHTHEEGNYQEVYRFAVPTAYVTPAEILSNALDVHELDRYLTMRGAIKEGARTKS